MGVGRLGLRVRVRFNFCVVTALPNLPILRFINIDQLRQDGDFGALWEIGPNVFHRMGAGPAYAVKGARRSVRLGDPEEPKSTIR